MPALPALLRALLVWLLLMAAESVHGALRRLLFRTDSGLAIRQLSVVVGAVLIFAIAWLTSRWLNLRSDASALAVGVLWVVLTLAFELLIGRAVGLDWTQMAPDYDLAHGGLMPLGLLAMALTPWIVRRLKPA